MKTIKFGMNMHRKDLKSMLNDPRYWDSSRRDPAYVRRVTELYEKAYKGQSNQS